MVNGASARRNILSLLFRIVIKLQYGSPFSNNSAKCKAWQRLVGCIFMAEGPEWTGSLRKAAAEMDAAPGPS